uniref:protein-serine/threonine phosphatase n=1 Tax=Zea mays TaxID=4577 RepID=A0A804NP93_MAIZE
MTPSQAGRQPSPERGLPDVTARSSAAAEVRRRGTRRGTGRNEGEEKGGWESLGGERGHRVRSRVVGSRLSTLSSWPRDVRSCVSRLAAWLGSSAPQRLRARRVEDVSGRRLDVVQSNCTALSIVKHGDLMVVANVDDSRVVLGIATYDDAITPSSSSST